MYYHITAFEGTRDIQGFSGPWGYIPFFRSLPDQRWSPSSSSEAVISKSIFPIYPLPTPSSSSPLLPILSSSSFLRYTLPLPSAIPPSLPSSIPSFLMLSPSLPLSSPLPTSHPLFPLNHLPFPYFSLPSTSSLTFKPSPCLISSPSPVLTIICNTICNTSYNTIYTTSPRAADGHPSPSSATFAHPLHVYPPLDTHPLQCYTSYVTRSLRPLRVYSFACFTSIKELIVWSSPRSSNVVAQPRSSNVVT